MFLLNPTKNTLYIEDVDLHIPCQSQGIVIPYGILKKSQGLRNLIVNGTLKVLDYDSNEQIEKAIMFSINNNQGQIENSEEKQELSKNKSSDIQVKLHGIFYEAGGYGKVNRYLAYNLSKMGASVKVSAKKGQNHLNFDELQDIVKLEKTQLSKDFILIDSIIPSFSEISSARYKILYTTVEAYSLPQQFIDCCQSYNELWITSYHAEKIIRKYIKDKPVIVVPTGVDPEVYNEAIDPVEFNPPLNSFIFLSVFGWSYRKGYDLLLRAYFEAFEKNDDVSLLIFSRYMQGTSPNHNKKIQEDISKLGLRTENTPHYKVISKIIPENMMPQIYRACDAFVLPTRGESSNLCVGEASLCGLPVIMTNCSGQTIFLNSENSYLLEIDNLEKVIPNTMHLHFWDNQLFPSLRSEKCIKNLAGLMRNVYENYNGALEKNKKLQDLFLSKFTWKHAAEIAFSRLKEIKL